MKLVRMIAVFIGLLIVQIYILPFFSVIDLTPDAVLIGIIYLAMNEGGVAAMIVGLLAGLVRDAFTTHFVGAYMLSYVVAGFLAGVFFKYREKMSVQVQTAYLFLVIFLFHFLFFALFLLDGGAGLLQVIFRYTLPAALYTLTVTAIAHFLLPRGFWQ